MPTLLPMPGDTENQILQKILSRMGGVPRPGDLDTSLLRKILTGGGGVFHPGDMKNTLYRKINGRLGSQTFPGDDTNKLLFRLVGHIEANPAVGDTDAVLLAKWARSVTPFSDNAAANDDVTVTPGLDPDGDPEIDVDIDNPNLAGKWLAIWVSITAPGEPLTASDFKVFAIVGIQNDGRISVKINLGITPSGLLQICVLATIGQTRNAALSADLSALIAAGKQKCFNFPDDFPAGADDAIAAAGQTVNVIQMAGGAGDVIMQSGF